MKALIRISLACLTPLLVATTAAGCLYGAEERLTFDSDNSPVGSVTIEGLAGSIYVQRDASSRRVHGSVFVDVGGQKTQAVANELLRQVTIIESVDLDGAMTLRVALPSGLRGNDLSVSFDLFVPDSVTVHAFTENAPIQIDGLPVGTVDTTNASVELIFTTGAATIRTENGLVRIDGHDGDLNVRTRQAPIEMFAVTGSVRASTTDGYVTCQAAPYIGGEIAIATTNGEITLRLPYNFGADLVATTTNGEVYIDDLDFRPDFSDVGHFEGMLYDGRGVVDLRTSNADIFVRSRQ